MVSKVQQQRFRAAFQLIPSFGLGFLALAVVGCGGGTSGMEQRATGFLDEKVEGDKVVERFDFNGDGISDMEKVLVVRKVAGMEDVRSLIEKRMDLDYNGRFDLVVRYKDGVLSSEELDLDFDGRFDAVNVYKAGKLSEQQLSPGFDGRVSVWKYFDDEGVLTKKARDMDSDGTPDAWEYYIKQKLVRVGFDRDGDGSPEYFEDAKK